MRKQPTPPIGALWGIAGPALFIASWIVAGLLRDGYDIVDDAISRLAEQGAPYRVLVLTGIVIVSIASMLLGVLAWRRWKAGRAALVMAVAGSSALALAVFPCSPGCPGLDGEFTDSMHSIAAVVHYISFALSPLALALDSGGFTSRRFKALSILAGLFGGAFLFSQFTGWGPNGITQRIGLTTLDVWMMGTGVALIRDRTQFHFDPDTYLQLMTSEMPAYERLQDEVTAATEGIEVARILELGTGTGETARRVLALHPDAAYVGIDYGEAMLARAKEALPDADLRLGRLEEELPAGPFDLVISALTVHHLDAAGKADLFRRIAAVLAPRGRFVLGDVIIPDDPADVVTPIDGFYDKPSRVDEQLGWLAAAGLAPRVAWSEKDLAVLLAEPVFEKGE